MCRSGVVYAASVAGQRLTFEVAGFWRRNMVIRDRQTRSLWQQATGEAVAGPLRGHTLQMLGAEQTTWANWRQSYPDTWVTQASEDSRRGLVYLLPYQTMFALVGRVGLTMPGLAALDRRLPSHTDVAGISIAGEARAYPVSNLRKVGLVHDTVGGVPVAVLYDRKGDAVRAFCRLVDDRPLNLTLEDGTLAEAAGGRRWNTRGLPLTGASSPGLRPVTVSRQWWLAWSEFHPGTSVYE